MDVLILISIVEFIVISYLVGYIVYLNRTKNNESEDSMVEVEQLKLYSTFDFDKVDERIDNYIDDAGRQYKMDNFEYKDPDELYLNEDAMNDMIRYMIKEVRKRITPPILSLIKMSYNINSEDDLIELLYQRIRMYVLAYSIETNAEIEG